MAAAVENKSRYHATPLLKNGRPTTEPGVFLNGQHLATPATHEGGFLDNLSFLMANGSTDHFPNGSSGTIFQTSKPMSHAVPGESIDVYRQRARFISASVGEIDRWVNLLDTGNRARDRLQAMNGSVDFDEYARAMREENEGAVAQHQLSFAYLDLTVAIAHGYSRIQSDLSFEDLIQEGNRGLLKALSDFDKERGELKPHIALTVHRYIHDAIRKQRSLSRAIPYGAVSSGSSLPEFGGFYGREVPPVLARLIESGYLSPQDSEILRLHYGIGGGPMHTLKEARSKLPTPLSDNQIKFAHQQLLKKLRLVFQPDGEIDWTAVDQVAEKRKEREKFQATTREEFEELVWNKKTSLQNIARRFGVGTDTLRARFQELEVKTPSLSQAASFGDRLYPDELSQQQTLVSA